MQQEDGVPRSPEEVSARLRVSGATLSRWRKAGTGPVFIRLGSKRIRYVDADVDAWLAARRQADGHPIK
jgi:predicted DNA-binding transcriptional regulator AlpA